MWIRILEPKSGIFLTLDLGSGMENSDPGKISRIRNTEKLCPWQHFQAAYRTVPKNNT